MIKKNDIFIVLFLNMDLDRPRMYIRPIYVKIVLMALNKLVSFNRRDEFVFFHCVHSQYV